MSTRFLRNSLVRITLVILNMLLTYGAATGSAEGTTSPTIQQVMAGSLPKAGTDAYWAISPLNPNQKILLVPSLHFLNFRFVKPALAEAMKTASILIVETTEMKELISWDDPTLIQGVLPSLDLLKRSGAVRREPFLFDGTPWTTQLTPATLDFLKKNLAPSLHPLLEDKELFPAGLSKSPIDNLNPNIVLSTLLLAAKNKLNNIGIDRQILRHFQLNNRTILGLETAEEVAGGPLTVDAVKAIATSSVDKRKVIQSIENTIGEMKALDQAPPTETAKKIQQDLAFYLQEFQHKTPETESALSEM